MPASFRITGDEVEQPINKGLFKKKGFDFGKVPNMDKEVKNVENATNKFVKNVQKIKGTKKSLTKIASIEKGILTKFGNQVKETIKKDPSVLGVGAGGYAAGKALKNKFKKIGKCYEPYVQKDMYSINPQYARNPKSEGAVGAKKTKKK